MQPTIRRDLEDRRCATAAIPKRRRGLSNRRHFATVPNQSPAGVAGVDGQEPSHLVEEARFPADGRAGASDHAIRLQCVVDRVDRAFPGTAEPTPTPRAREARALARAWPTLGSVRGLRRGGDRDRQAGRRSAAGRTCDARATPWPRHRSPHAPSDERRSARLRRHDAPAGCPSADFTRASNCGIRCPGV